MQRAGRPAPSRLRWLWCALVRGHRWVAFQVVGEPIDGELCDYCSIIKIEPAA